MYEEKMPGVSCWGVDTWSDAQCRPFFLWCLSKGWTLEITLLFRIPAMDLASFPVLHDSYCRLQLWWRTFNEAKLATYSWPPSTLPSVYLTSHSWPDFPDLLPLELVMNMDSRAVTVRFSVVGQQYMIYWLCTTQHSHLLFNDDLPVMLPTLWCPYIQKLNQCCLCTCDTCPLHPPRFALLFDQDTAISLSLSCCVHHRCSTCPKWRLCGIIDTLKLYQYVHYSQQYITNSIITQRTHLTIYSTLNTAVCYTRCVIIITFHLQVRTIDVYLPRLSPMWTKIVNEGRVLGKVYHVRNVTGRENFNCMWKKQIPKEWLAHTLTVTCPN